jgi:hypothetical protein
VNKIVYYIRYQNQCYKYNTPISTGINYKALSDDPVYIYVTMNVLCKPMQEWTCFFFFLVSLGGVRLSPLGTSATVGLLYQPRMIDDDDGAVGGMRIGRGNRSTRRKPAPVPLCPPQIPHDLSWDGIRAAAVGSRRLTA